MMSMSEGRPNSEGVAAGRARKRRLWLLYAALTLLLVAVDAVFWSMMHHTAPGQPRLSPTAGIVGATLSVLLLNSGVLLHFHYADELDGRHNLIAFSVGFLFNLSAWIAWLFLSTAGLAPKPVAGVLTLSSALASGVVYASMKIRAYLG